MKGPLRREVIKSNFNYNKADDIYKFLSDKFLADDKKHYFLIEPEKINERREGKLPLPIKFCREKHMISFFHDGSVQTKINICSCEECLKGEFVKCSYEAGKSQVINDCSDDEECSEFDSDEEIENEDLCYEDVIEENEIRADCVIDVVQPGSHVALYSSLESFKIFYLCYVVESGIASECMRHDYNHFIDKGVKYLKCKTENTLSYEVFQ